MYSYWAVAMTTYPISVEVKIEWSYTCPSPPTWCLHGTLRGDLYLLMFVWYTLRLPISKAIGWNY